MTVLLEQNIVRATEDELESLCEGTTSAPDDSFDALKRRARFDKKDNGLLRDWFAVAAHRGASRSTDMTLNAIGAGSLLERQ
jgi:hypothetical protein